MNTTVLSQPLPEWHGVVSSGGRGEVELVVSVYYVTHYEMNSGAGTRIAYRADVPGDAANIDVKRNVNIAIP